MITADFFRDGGRLIGFSVRGHAGFAPEGEDIVCAAVSSAVELTANGITEILGADACVQAPAEGEISFRLAQGSPEAEWFLRALQLQLELIAEDYPEYVRVISPERSCTGSDLK